MPACSKPIARERSWIVIRTIISKYSVCPFVRINTASMTKRIWTYKYHARTVHGENMVARAFGCATVSLFLDIDFFMYSDRSTRAHHIMTQL